MRKVQSQAQVDKTIMSATSRLVALETQGRAEVASSASVGIFDVCCQLQAGLNFEVLSLQQRERHTAQRHRRECLHLSEEANVLRRESVELDAQVDRLRSKCERAQSRARDCEVSVDVDKAEVKRVQGLNDQLSSEVSRLSQLMVDKDGELVRLRAQLTERLSTCRISTNVPGSPRSFASHSPRSPTHTGGSSPIQSGTEGSARRDRCGGVSPASVSTQLSETIAQDADKLSVALRHALGLAAGLRQHASDTSATLYKRRGNDIPGAALKACAGADLRNS